MDRVGERGALTDRKVLRSGRVINDLRLQEQAMARGEEDSVDGIGNCVKDLYPLV